MEGENSVIVCKCSETGSINFHPDERETVVVVNGKIYELVASERTLDDLRELPADEAPHVRHLNCIPTRTRAEQKVHKEKSAHKVLEVAREVVKEKQTKEYEIQKEKAKVAAVGQPILVKTPRKSKCREIVE